MAERGMEQRERALHEADRMRILASEYRQMGFSALAAWLRKNADRAMMWATNPPNGGKGR